jgi:phytanoyl-CoA hydroxylase
MAEQNVAELAGTLKEKGYVIIKGVFDEETLQKYRSLTERIVKYGDTVQEDPFQNFYLKHRTDQGALYDLFQRHPEFQDLAKNKIILDTMVPILGEDILLYENSLVYKPKSRGNAVPWHQDFISRPDEPLKLIAWIAFDNVRIENGAMKVIPGTHKNGFMEWYRVKKETHHDRIRPELIDESKAVYAEMNAGDVLIFNQLLCHSSDECHSDMPRRAYRVAYQGFDNIAVPRGTPIVVRGGLPENLYNRYGEGKYHHEELPLIRRGLRYIGRRLAKI